MEFQNSIKTHYNSGLIENKYNNMYEHYRWFNSRHNYEQYYDTFTIISNFLRDYSKRNALNEILEIGAGAGTWTKLLFPYSPNRIDIADISISMINQAKQTIGNRDNVFYTETDFLTNKFRSDNYDLIMAIRCFEYFEDKNKFFSEINLKLKKGCRALIITKMKKNSHSRFQHTLQVTPQETCIIAENCGLKIIEVKPVSVDIIIPKITKFYRLSRWIVNKHPDLCLKYLKPFVESYSVVVEKN